MEAKIDREDARPTSAVSQDTAYTNRSKEAAEPVSWDVIREGLSCLSSSNMGFAFTQLSLDGVDVSAGIESSGMLRNLQFLELRNGNLQEPMLDSLGAIMPGLVHADASHNALTSLPALSSSTFLQVLMLAHNNINGELQMNGVALQPGQFLRLSQWPYLHTLDLSDNAINSLRFESRALISLNVSGNQLETLEGLRLPALDSVNASQNRIRTVRLKLPALRSLNLSGNLIRSDDLLELSGWATRLPSLEILNLRENQIDDSRALRRLGVWWDCPHDCFPGLRELFVAGNPFATAEDFDANKHLIQMLAYVPGLKRLDDLPLMTEEEEKLFATKEQLEEAAELRRQQLLSEQESADETAQRLRAEREEKKRLEAEAAAEAAAAAEEAAAAHGGEEEEEGTDYVEESKAEPKVSIFDRIQTRFGIDWAALDAKLPYNRTPEHKARRRQLFEEFDVCMTGNDFLDYSEVESGILELLGIDLFRFDVRPAIRQAFQIACDYAKKGDSGRGHVELIEFRIMLQYVKQFIEFFTMFSAMDSDEDRSHHVEKSLTFDEFFNSRDLLTEFGVHVEEDDAQRVFDLIDTGNNGTISFPEFAAYSIKQNLDFDKDPDDDALLAAHKSGKKNLLR